MSDRRRSGTFILAAAAAAAVCVAVVPSAGAAVARSAGAALNKSGFAKVTSVSCASAGNCSAGGSYASGPSVSQAFVVSEVHGTWRQAEEVPGTAGLNKGGEAEITSLSCASAGNCSAGGYYAPGYNQYGVPYFHAFVVSEVNGTWRRAVELRGPDTVGYPEVWVSCASAGNCSAGGDGQEPFVVSEAKGTWRRAEEVPGIAALNKSGRAGISSVSCGSASSCSAGGYYTSGLRPDGTEIFQAFVVSRVKGIWQKAREVPGTAALNKHGSAAMTSVSCASAGNCSATGYYDDYYASGSRSFVVSEVKGTWRKAEEVPDGAEIGPVSCASAGNCSAGLGDTQGVFGVSEVHGTWRKAQRVPGIAALDKGGSAAIGPVSCASAGNCSAAGTYTDPRSVNTQLFVVSEVKGTWRRAEELPGIATLNKGRPALADVSAVSCASPGNCSAGGYYEDASHVSQAFVVSEVNGTWRKAEEVPGTKG